MTDSVFTDWSEDMAAAFGKRPFMAQHGVHERPLFSDDGLAELIDRFPREALVLYTMNDDPRIGHREFRLGSPGNLTGHEILEAVARGRLWLNLRKANLHMPAYANLCEELFDALDARVPGLKTFKRDCGVLISSPGARVFYHLDIPMVTLWQIRGTKTFHVYPTGTPYARDEQIEAIILRETEEEIDYDTAFEAAATTYELTPGTMASWPQNAPHRIDNGPSVNVSLSCEFQTFPSLVRANALYANGILRRRFGHSPSIEHDGKAARYGKAGLARLFKLFGSGTDYERPPVLSFIVDLNAENAVRDLTAA